MDKNSLKQQQGENKTEPKVPTLTISQAVRMFRDAGMSMGQLVLASGIQQGLYPFEICVITDAGSRRFEIYEKLLMKYLAERSEDTACIS